MLSSLSATFRSFLGAGNTAGSASLGGLLGQALQMGGAGEAPGDQFASWLPYSAYVPEDRLFVNRETLGFMLEVAPQSGADERMVEILLSLYATCPKGTGIQLMLFGSPSVIDALSAYGNLRVEDADQGDKAQHLGRPSRNANLYRTLARRRADHFLRGAHTSLTQGYHYTVRDFRLMASVCVPGSIANMSLRDDLLMLRESISTTLRAASLPNRVCSADDLINWCALFCNPHRIRDERLTRLHYDDGREIRDQIVDFDTVQEATPLGLVFAKPGREEAVEARCYSVKSFPERFALWQMNGLIGDLMQPALQYSCPFLISMGVHIPDPTTIRTVVMANHVRAAQNARSKMAQVMPDVPRKLEDWQAAADTLDQGGQIVNLYHQLALFTTPGDATTAEENAKVIWRGRGFELNNDTYMHRQALIASLPMTLSARLYNDMRRMRRVSRKTVANAVHLAPLIGEWRGTSTPTLILAGRRGQLMSLDLYDNDQGNYNAAIIGTPGSGKSVWMNEIAWSYRATDSQVRLLDLGRSFEKLCRKADGQFIEFGAHSPINVNPFTVVDNIERDMAMLTPVIAKMASLSAPLEEVQYKAINAGILRVWRAHGKDMTITALRDLFKSGTIEDLEIRSDTRIKDLAIMLEPYTRDGQYARFFEGRANIDFSNDFMVIENEELKRAPDLHAVVNMILLYQITQDMYLSRERGDHRKKLLMIDELMQQLGEIGTDDPVKARVVEEAARRARKYGGSLITATQGADDYYSSKQMETAFQFADWVFLLRQKKESIELLERSGRIVMDDAKKRLLNSLRTEPGVYSEIYIYSPMGEGVGRLILDPHTLLLFSNRHEDNQAIDERRARGLSIDQAIAEVLRERGGKPS
jgi:conjugal transfer ATP-binding protein TraC